MSSTRERILSAAREMTEKQGAAPTMSALARMVGISRQALYLHFPDRAQLLLALVADIDEKEQLQAGSAAVREAADAAGAIRAWARMQACRNPKIAAAARALNATRHADPAAACAAPSPSSSGCVPKDGSTRPGPSPRRPPCCGS